jgi:K(+)-stimulated pyrophosphate-energized sodium pump
VALVGRVALLLNIESDLRTAAAASKGYNPALQASYPAGLAVGLLAAGLGLLGSGGIVLLYGPAAPDVLFAFVIGGAVSTLLLRLGGSIYAGAVTNAPPAATSDDPAAQPDTPAAAAPALVGQQAASAGGAADLLESQEIAFFSALTLGLILADAAAGDLIDGMFDMRFVLFPLLLRAVGVLAALLGGLLVRTDDRRRNARAAINRGLYVAAALTLVGGGAFTFLYMADPVSGAIVWQPYAAIAVGVVIALLLDRLARYFTASSDAPTKATSRAARSGPAPNVMAGMAAGFEASAGTGVLLVLALGSSLVLAEGTPPALYLPTVLYYLALTAVGLLSMAAATSAMQSFGATANNARRLGQLGGSDKNARNALEDLDAVGTTLRAATSGVATGAAVLAALALLGSSLVGISYTLTFEGLVLAEVPLSPTLLIGLLLGGALPLLVAALVLRAGVRGATHLHNAARQQENTDDARGAVLRNAAATVPIDALLVGLLLPLLVLLAGALWGLPALAGVRVGALLVGLLLTMLLISAGGAWHNARAYIEDGFYGGKNSAAHQASAVGATVGGPLRAIAAPALTPVIKLTGLLAMLLEPFPLPGIGGVAVAVGALLLLAVVLWRGGREVEVETPAAPATRTTSTKSRI